SSVPTTMVFPFSSVAVSVDALSPVFCSLLHDINVTDIITAIRIRDIIIIVFFSLNIFFILVIFPSFRQRIYAEALRSLRLPFCPKSPQGDLLAKRTAQGAFLPKEPAGRF